MGDKNNDINNGPKQYVHTVTLEPGAPQFILLTFCFNSLLVSSRTTPFFSGPFKSILLGVQLSLKAHKINSYTGMPPSPNYCTKTN